MSQAARSLEVVQYTSKFRRSYKKLPLKTKLLAESREKIFRKNIFDPKLRTHKLKGELGEFWSFSLTHSHRIIFKFIDNQTALFYDIGDHRIYQ